MASAAGAVGLWLFSAFGEMALAKGTKSLVSRLKDRTARRALAEICAEAIEAAAVEAPLLAEDFRSESFLGGVVAPLVQSMLEDPSVLVGPDDFAGRYIDMFVARFASGQELDGTLLRIFQTDRAQLVTAFAAFVAALKSGLYRSEHWKDAEHHRATERILADVGRVLQIIENREDEKRAGGVDIAQARRDARTASVDLRSWPTDIHGVRIEPPALDLLINHIVDTPAGKSLLVGDPGSGKSALFARLADELTARGIICFAIKADLLPTDLASLADLAAALGVADGLEDRIAALAAEAPVVLMIDQLDAVSDVMDSSTARMRLLLRLVHEICERGRLADAPLRIHTLVSSRPFEAAHDARFRQLHAEEFRLDRLSEEDLSSFLGALAIEETGIDAGLRQTLRRPFALKLFADIARSGAGIEGLHSSQLLDRWLVQADLGDAAMRQACTLFLLEFAREMVETESLWRPADRFDLQHRDAVRRCIACGLVIRKGASLGFSHQSWLDDFQAKGFATGRSLAEYCWAHQDSLFVRASILRGLERLRAYDWPVFEAAVVALLNDARTRRHVRHLLADLLSTSAAPTSFEAGWIEAWIVGDKPLASRALGQVGERWEAWRDHLRPLLPVLMQDGVFHWHAVRLLGGEVKRDADHVAGLVEAHWGDPDHDRLVFNLLETAGFMGAAVKERLRTIFSRTPIDEHGVAHLISTLRAEQRYIEAVDVLLLWLDAQELGNDAHPDLYELEKLAEAAPERFIEAVLPWFLAVAAREVIDGYGRSENFPVSRSLPWNWAYEQGRGGVFEALLTAVRALGSSSPDTLWLLLAPAIESEIDQAQEVVAVGLIAVGSELAAEAHAFLLADWRRFSISSVHVDGEDDIGRTIVGWHSHEIVRAIVPGLDDNSLIELRDAIEAWNKYAGAEGAAADRRRYLAWSDEARLPLLEPLPPHIIAARRRRKIAEWRAGQPKYRGKPNQLGMAKMVGSAMTHEEMSSARDEDIIRLLDEIHDRVGDFHPSRPLTRHGGVRELARAFAAFGKTHPDRALAIAAGHFRAGKHERAAGALVQELAGLEESDHPRLLVQIVDWAGRGFDSYRFRQNAAGALADIARFTGGLRDEHIALLESWLETDSAAIERQIATRREFEARNSKPVFDEKNPQPVLFGSMGGMNILPQDNFTILTAIANGLLCRDPAGVDDWVSALDGHLGRPEDPHVWTAILLWRSNSFPWASEARVSQLILALWRKYPEVFEDFRLTRFLWSRRSLIDDEIWIDVMARWLAGDDRVNQQAAGELICAGRLVDPDSILFEALSRHANGKGDAVRTGIMLSAAAAWRERDPSLRMPAHLVLMDAIPTADGPVVEAISSAVDRHPTMIADEQSKELMAAMLVHEPLLIASLDRRFLDALQSLLFHPGFDEIVLAMVQRIAKLVVEPSGKIRALGLIGREIVYVAIALQRSDGPLRSQAMDLYEILLDARIYGAEEAASSAIGR